MPGWCQAHCWKGLCEQNAFKQVARHWHALPPKFNTLKLPGLDWGAIRGGGKLLSYQTNTNKVRVRWKISKVRPKNTGELVVPFLVRVDELSLEN